MTSAFRRSVCTIIRNVKFQQQETLFGMMIEVELGYTAQKEETL
jgi:hypothetical protein